MAECSEDNQSRYSCANCKMVGHASWDRTCPSFIEVSRRLELWDLENSYRYFPSDEPWTWEQEGCTWPQEEGLGQKNGEPDRWGGGWVNEATGALGEDVDGEWDLPAPAGGGLQAMASQGASRGLGSTNLPVGSQDDGWQEVPSRQRRLGELRHPENGSHGQGPPCS